MSYDPTDIKAWLTLDEGRELKEYIDPKNPTHRVIGIGFDIAERGWPPFIPKDRDLKNVGISDVECDRIFERVISGIMGCVRCKLSWFDALDIVRQNVLLNIAFNVGESGLFKFVHMLAFASQGMYAQAAAEILASDAARELPERYKRLHDCMIKGGTQ